MQGVQKAQVVACLGCYKSFQEGECLPAQGIHIQYKNYYLPVREHQQRWILLKTVIAFLNSKGGTIYMGVDDSTRQVIGVLAELKEQDKFMLDFDVLLNQIRPEIDLRHKEEVRVQFVPVLKDKTFQGKYVIKIIVKQGDPAKVYHFAQTLKLVNQDKSHHDQQHKVLWGFYRSNMGKVDSIKGTELLREVYEKAKRPSKQWQTFHSGCNPQPLRVGVRNMNIGFKNIPTPSLRQSILSYISLKLKQLLLQDSYTIDKSQQKIIMLKFKSITEYKEADVYILQHIDQLGEMIDSEEVLIDEGTIDNTHFYKFGKDFDPTQRYRRKVSPNRNNSSLNKRNKNSLEKNKSLPKKPIPADFIQSPTKKTYQVKPLSDIEIQKIKSQQTFDQNQTKQESNELIEGAVQSPVVIRPSRFDFDNKKKQIQSPLQKKVKLGVLVDPKSCRFYMSNIQTSLSKSKRTQFIDLLYFIFKNYCPSKKIQILNKQNFFKCGLMQLNFNSKQDRLFFNTLMFTEIVKHHQFTNFFIGFKCLWGQATGNVIIRHYKPNLKEQFYQIVQNTIEPFGFPFNIQFVKDKQDKYFMTVKVEQINLTKVLSILLTEIKKPQLAKMGYGQGIVVIPQIKRM